ncbi:MAG: hypothetical protein Q8R36_02360 [bacterium]|nr:hypothetical protein [bacterium]
MLENSEKKTLESSKVIAALKYHDEIFTGVLHSDAMLKLREKYSNHDGGAVVTGFLITETGEFTTDRKKALEIADRAGQVRKGKSLSRVTGGLHSEDLRQ